MPRVNRNRSQTLSLRIQPVVRFALECISNAARSSMTETVEGCVVRALDGLMIEGSDFLNPRYAVDGKIKGADLFPHLWHADSLTRLLKTGVLAPGLLSADDLFAYRVFVGLGRYAPRGEPVCFLSLIHI